jgi:hypothetical protein
MRAGFEYFKSFEQDARDFAAFATRRLDMPFLVLTGEKASGTFLIDQAKLVADQRLRHRREERRPLAATG